VRVSERAAALAHAQNLFSELSTLTSHSPRHRACRDELIEMHLPLVRYLARRFRNRGEPYDDLLQVGTIGLMKAVDHFEPDRGVAFSTYATPLIIARSSGTCGTRGGSSGRPDSSRS